MDSVIRAWETPEYFENEEYSPISSETMRAVGIFKPSKFAVCTKTSEESEHIIKDGLYMRSEDTTLELFGADEDDYECGVYVNHLTNPIIVDSVEYHEIFNLDFSNYQLEHYEMMISPWVGQHDRHKSICEILDLLSQDYDITMKQDELEKTMQNRMHLICRLCNVISVWDFNITKLYSVLLFNNDCIQSISIDDEFKRVCRCIAYLFRENWNYSHADEFWSMIDTKPTVAYTLNYLRGKNKFVDWMYENVNGNNVILESTDFDIAVMDFLTSIGFLCYNISDNTMWDVRDYRTMDSIRFEGTPYIIDFRRFLPGYDNGKTVFTDKFKPYEFEDDGLFRKNYYYDRQSYPEENQSFIKLLCKCYNVRFLGSKGEDLDFSNIVCKSQDQFGDLFMEHIMPRIYKLSTEDLYNGYHVHDDMDIVRVGSSRKREVSHHYTFGTTSMWYINQYKDIDV